MTNPLTIKVTKKMYLGLSPPFPTMFNLVTGKRYNNCNYCGKKSLISWTKRGATWRRCFYCFIDGKCNSTDS